MKIKLVKFAIFSFVAFFVFVSVVEAQSILVLDKKFNLAGEPSQETQYFLVESKLITYALDGTRVRTDIYRLRLKCVPSKVAGKEGDKYTCVRFTLKQGDALEAAIPALENWTYVFKQAGLDEKGQVFGIDHGKFENLIDSSGNTLPPDKAYHVYNAFIDFHAFCNVFADWVSDGKGIQDLTNIGQKILHAAAFSEAPVNLGEGSFFRNGEITLEFKGLSMVNNRTCALVGYDSGDSSFQGKLKPAPDMEINTVGSSHYMGDIYKDLESNWVQKVTLSEFVVTEMTLPMQSNKMNSVVERRSLIRNVSAEEFAAK